ncbi:aldehyde dehydrogenase [Aeromicrobium sp. Leaf350]|uniref:aldehyde dehydrogenase family protein n=1 Tax=Aeromicrobium sp. Leaf350 TaxID=2876565 RepID=UPI0021024AF5|nr:aldehyde dehydrogenase [Aeromicrobium sp. Leaf350]
MSTVPETPARLRNYVAGQWRECAVVTDSWNLDPNTCEHLHPSVTTPAEHVEEALRHAAEQYDPSPWDEATRRERADALQRAANLLEERTEDIARADAMTSGTAIGATRVVASFLPHRVRAAAEEVLRIPRITALDAGGRDVRRMKVPWGPAAILTPWNGPSFIPASKVASAIAAGCPVILKPSEHAPSSAQLVAECFIEANLPDGAFQLVHGAGDVGSTLTSDPRIKVISFTGGPTAGRAIARAAAENFTVLQLELGGNNPVIVLDDADLDVTADGILEGMTKLNGQWCEGPGKVLAPRDLVDPLVDALNARIANLRVGHSLDEATDVGPISNAPHFRTLQQRVAAMREAGATIHEPADLPELPGLFLSPTVAVGADAESTNAELFGPLVSVHGVASQEEAVRIANAAPSGLDAYVFGTDTDRAMEVGARLVAGEVRVNGAKVADLADGSAQSFWGPAGIGGHGPDESVRVFCGDRVVGVDSADLPL